MSSWGSWSMTARATVSPPNPESKMPIGASESATTSAQPTSDGRATSSTQQIASSRTAVIDERRGRTHLSPDLGVEKILTGVEVAAVGPGGQVLPAAIGDDQHDVCPLPCLDGLGALRQCRVHDRSRGEPGEDAFAFQQLADAPDGITGTHR